MTARCDYCVAVRMLSSSRQLTTRVVMTSRAHRLRFVPVGSCEDTLKIAFRDDPDHAGAAFADGHCAVDMGTHPFDLQLTERSV